MFIKPVSMYDPNRFDRSIPANVRGGIGRAKSAERDTQGRFLPNDKFLASLVTPDPYHGVAGGRARATGKRNNGRFCKG